MNMQAFTAVDLANLPDPLLVEPLDFETIFQALLSDFQARYPDYNSIVESDPAYKVLEAAAFRELIIRQRVNDAAKGVMLAKAAGSDLDQMGALPWINLERLEVSPADLEAIPPIQAVMESDDNYRLRLQLALEGLTVAGPRGSYIYHVLNSSADVKDVAVISPEFSAFDESALLQATRDDLDATVGVNRTILVVDNDAGLANPLPGDLGLYVLSRTGDGSADQALLDTVSAAVTDYEVRPLTDNPQAFSAQVQNYSIDAVLSIDESVDPVVVLAAAQASAEAFVADSHKVGVSVPLSAIYAALHVPGVLAVTLNSPASTVAVDSYSAPYCTSISVVQS